MKISICDSTDFEIMVAAIPDKNLTMQSGKIINVLRELRDRRRLVPLPIVSLVGCVLAVEGGVVGARVILVVDQGRQILAQPIGAKV